MHVYSPLLLRVRYSEPDILDRISQIAYSQNHFGSSSNFELVKNEILQVFT